MTISFWKTEALGNDFVLVHADAVGSLDLAALAVKVCDRHTGVGSDGLLVLSRDLVLRMFNPDGTEDFCGNGLRCAAWYARAQGWADDSLTLTHRGVKVPSSIDDQGVVSVELGPPSFQPSMVPLDINIHPHEMWLEPFHGFTASALSTGSTHLVLLVDQLPEDPAFFDVSPVMELDPVFPERTSVLWVARKSDHVAKMRIWERGAGETLACGTGNVAVAAVLTRLSGRGGTYTLHNPGGTARVSIESDLSHPVLSSPVWQVFEGRLLI